MKFNYNGKTYSSTWSDGYVLLPVSCGGIYLTATWVDGKPEDIHQRKLYVAPATYAKATLSEGSTNAS